MKIVLNYTCNGILLIDFLQRKISKNHTLLENPYWIYAFEINMDQKRKPIHGGHTT